MTQRLVAESLSPTIQEAQPTPLMLNAPDPRIMQTWYDRATVRKGDHRTRELPLAEPSVEASADVSAVVAELRASRNFFPPALMPHVFHPLVERAGPQAQHTIAARHLFHYLSFTAHFEVGVVNRAAGRIAQGNSGVRVPTNARLDALKIYTDEGYHALFSLDLVARLEAVTGVAMLPYDFRPYLRALDGIGHRVLPGREELAQLLQVVVFETLVTSILTAVPTDQSVLGVVRATVADHAEDERRHHAYFAAFFRELWAGLDPADRAATGRCLPQLIRQSLEPDLTPAADALAAAGLPQRNIATVLEECYPADRQATTAAEISRHSVRLFQNCGVLELPEAAEAFAEAGLLPQAISVTGQGGPTSEIGSN